MLFATVTVVPAIADETRNAPRTDQDRRGDPIRPHPGGLIEMSWLIDRPVRNTEGKELGRIEHVWFDPKNGQVKEVVVAVGGLLGIDDRHKLIRWNDLNVAWQDQKLIVVMDQNVLRDAPKYEGRGSPRAGR
jgi:sporulation protein YlmC with PRC-barrel domain